MNKKKKRIILFSVIAALALGVIIISLFVPMVKIIGKDSDKNIVFDQTVSLIEYLKLNPFITTEAGDVYFNATGPIWLATSGILFHFLTTLFAGVLFVFCIVEVSTAKVNEMAIKNNVIAKKLAYFVGFFVILVGVFSIVSFMLTSLLANGYVDFAFSVEPVLSIIFGIAIIVLAILTEKRNGEQNFNKVKNVIGYLGILLFSVLTLLMLYIPTYNQDHFGEYNTLSKVSGMADLFVGDSAGIDYPFGLMKFTIWATHLVLAFLIIYSVIGLILTFRNKSTNWLSSRVKRWGMTLIVLGSIILILAMCQASTILASFFFEDIYLFTSTFYVFIATIFVPYIFSGMISYHKAEKLKQ